MDAYVQLTGNVGGTVEFRNNSVPVASFRLAHTPRVRRNGEWGDAPTTWIPGRVNSARITPSTRFSTYTIERIWSPLPITGKRPVRTSWKKVVWRGG